MSVVVPTYQRAALLAELLEALERQTLASARYEVVVVDDHSTDDTWDTLRKWAARTSLRALCLRLPANSGSGAARSAAVARCRAPVTAFTDDDCLPVPVWLERLCGPMLADGPAQVPAVVVQGRTLPQPEELAAAGPWARTLWIKGPTWLFETCNIAYRTADLLAVGGFPVRGETPATPTGGQVGEDALAGWRVTDLGVRLRFEPEALVHHRVVPSTYWQWLSDLRGRAAFPALAAQHRAARQAFWARWFLTPRSAATVLGLAAGTAAVATRRPALGIGVAPWIVLALPDARHRWGRHPVLRLAQLAVGDLVGLWAAARASARHRVLVL